MTTLRVPVVERILSANDRLAEQNRVCLDAARVLGINIMASPGAGKTSTILQTIKALSPRVRIGVVEGDTAPVTIDADKIMAAGMPAVQVNTGGECHLDAPMVARALAALDLSTLDLVLIENVGNLVCPAEFDVGEHRKAMVYSITEGEDKPLKYPVMFRSVAAVVVNKIDLAPYLDFDLDLFRRNLASVNPSAKVFELSARTGEGVAAWVAWAVGTSPR